MANGSVGSFVGADGDMVFTFDVTGDPDTTVNVSIADAVANDLAGNDNNSSNVLEWYYDATNPTVTLSATLGPISSPTNTATYNVTAEFSENVTGFDDTDVVVGNGGVVPLSFVAVDGDTYTFDVTATATGLVTVDVPAASAIDGATNPNDAATQLSWTYDGTAPTVTINQAVGQDDPTNISPVHFTVQFYEAVTDFDDTGDVSVSGAGSLVVSITPLDGDAYDVEVDVTTLGTVIATVPAGGAADLASNLNDAATRTDNEVTYDPVAPTVTVDTDAGQDDPTNVAAIEFKVQFSENVTGFDSAADVTITGPATFGGITAVRRTTW